MHAINPSMRVLDLRFYYFDPPLDDIPFAFFCTLRVGAFAFLGAIT